MSILDQPYSVSAEAISQYQRDGFVRLSAVLDADAINEYGKVISDAVVDLNTMHLPMEERSTYDRAFLQVTNLWTKKQAVKPIVFSKRLAGIAADLLQVDSVRLYHDQALYKEPGGGHTPWHADQYYWPLSTDRCVTAWIPLQETPLEMGPLEFSAGSHTVEIGRDLPISDESEVKMQAILESRSDYHVVEPFEIGDVSFHSGWLFHRAGPNSTQQTRRVMCVIYMDADMRLKTPENDNQELDREVWCPGVEVGSVIDSPINPVLFSR